MSFAFTDIKRSLLYPLPTEDFIECYEDLPPFGLIQTDFRGEWQMVWSCLQKYTYSDMYTKFFEKKNKDNMMERSALLRHNGYQRKAKNINTDTRNLLPLIKRNPLSLDDIYQHTKLRRKSIDKRDTYRNKRLMCVCVSCINDSSKNLTLSSFGSLNSKNINKIDHHIKNVFNNNKTMINRFRSITQPLFDSRIILRKSFALNTDKKYQAHVKYNLKKYFSSGIDKLPISALKNVQKDFDYKVRITFNATLKPRCTLFVDRNSKSVLDTVLLDHETDYVRGKMYLEKSNKQKSPKDSYKSKMPAILDKTNNKFNNTHKNMELDFLKSYAFLLPKVKVEKNKLINYLESRRVITEPNRNEIISTITTHDGKTAFTPLLSKKSALRAENIKTESKVRFRTFNRKQEISTLTDKNIEYSLKTTQQTRKSTRQTKILLPNTSQSKFKQYSELYHKKEPLNENVNITQNINKNIKFTNFVSTESVEVSIDNQNETLDLEAKKPFRKTGWTKMSPGSLSHKGYDQQVLIKRLSQNKGLQVFLNKFSQNKEITYQINSPRNVESFKTFDRDVMKKLIDERLKTIFVDDKSPRRLKL